MAHAVRYSRFGDPDVLEIVEIDIPEPGEGEVLVEVIATGVNPSESADRRGETAEREPIALPARQGREFAGIVRALGDGVTGFSRGSEVIGWIDRGAHATHLVAPVGQLVLRPPGVTWEVASALPVAGTTAWQAVEGLGLGAADTVVVTAAAGGVGCLAAQFARLRGATVVGTSADARFDFLRQFGVVPIAYGPDLAERVRAAVPGAVTAFLDFLGGESGEAHDLGVPRSRVLTTLDRAAVDGDLATLVGMGDRYALQRVARQIADKQVRLPIADIFPLDRVADAYRALDRRDAPGKIVLGAHLVGYAGQRAQEPALKEQDVTLGVATPHDHLQVEEAVPSAIGDGSVRRRRRDEREQAVQPGE